MKQLFRAMAETMPFIVRRSPACELTLSVTSWLETLLFSFADDIAVLELFDMPGWYDHHENTPI